MQNAPERMNDSGTRSTDGPKLTHGCSGPVRFELVEADGRIRVTSESATFLAEHAKRLWPDQEQDPDRTGKGWDVQEVGAE